MGKGVFIYVNLDCLCIRIDTKAEENEDSSLRPYTLASSPSEQSKSRNEEKRGVFNELRSINNLESKQKLRRCASDISHL
mmetsp:Transcript_18694/g.27982  ORF Transcript_18694/g.27982 Transcript_18694/m.27982 type:complete len:80 (+) Transcript_18694:3187-3426(+)